MVLTAGGLIKGERGEGEYLFMIPWLVNVRNLVRYAF